MYLIPFHYKIIDVKIQKLQISKRTDELGVPIPDNPF